MKPSNAWLLPPLAFLLAAGLSALTWASGPVGAAYTFNGGRAFEDLKHLVSFGPRPPGSKSLAESREWMIGQLRSAGWKVEQDSFNAPTPLGDIPMVNLIAKLPGASPKVIMIAGHYDTKLEKQFRFVGANDGGSSAAFLLELARVLARQKHPVTYWLVFFDGEEALQHWTDTDSLYGSRHLAAELTSKGELDRIQAMILVDMIAGSHLDIQPDSNSTAWLNKMVFGAADSLGYKRYFPSDPVAISDDHTPFTSAGVSGIDLIGLRYGPGASAFGGYWHTAEDTVEHCSPTSMTIVGRVVLAALDRLEKSPRLR